MKVTLTEMHSIRDAIRTMYMSKRTWNEELEKEIDAAVSRSTDYYGKPTSGFWAKGNYSVSEQMFVDATKKLFRFGHKHITMLRFLDLSVIVEGLHRGATDDFDAHAKRLENRIIRSSTRLADYSTEELSDWYKGKIIPTDEALKLFGIELPKEFHNGDDTFVKAANGYILETMKNNRDVKRGLYMLSLPMTFTFKVNIIELAHIYRERGSSEGGANGTAAPELQLMMESLIDQLQEWYPMLTREYLLDICN